jgi:YHS domain-containing protein
MYNNNHYGYIKAGGKMKRVLIVLSIIVIITMAMPLSAGTKTEVKKCAVTGQAIAADAPVIKTEYKGLTYYFCCSGCKAKFQKEPDKYAYETETFYACSHCKLKSMKPRKCPKCGKEMTEHVHQVQYVCPMKSCNIQSNKPGKCPKCGMELKKKSLHDHSHAHKSYHKY